MTAALVRPFTGAFPGLRCVAFPSSNRVNGSDSLPGGWRGWSPGFFYLMRGPVVFDQQVTGPTVTVRSHVGVEGMSGKAVETSADFW